MTKRRASLTPDNFRFAAKFPRSITHENRLADPEEKQLRYFFDMKHPLQKKLLAFLIQIQPSLIANEGMKKIGSTDHTFDPNFMP
jgi:uncharacterized protein YecE (DUF72 family)